jgi:hypothetical protein
MVIVVIRAVELEYLVKILYRGQSWSRYIFTDSDSASTALVNKDCEQIMKFYVSKINQTIFVTISFFI